MLQHVKKSYSIIKNDSESATLPNNTETKPQKMSGSVQVVSFHNHQGSASKQKPAWLRSSLTAVII